jgi:2-polyprenyl-3-methyl-5-hydroxy-6-metoxy-1,4-benzoquinol methylase
MQKEVHMRILVAIANYGTKNRAYLDRLLQEYRSMVYDVHIVVLSNIPKDLGPDVEVVVGLPDKDPWSLPFAHKRIFAERLDDYDLFIYSEDDTLVQQRHIEAFLEVTAILPEDRIAGFLRYEEDAAGRRYCSTIHSLYHWVPSSVQSFGPHTFAYFTNEHSACYFLTRDQLRRAITSGGFLVRPHKGRYDMLCTAATDPYTQCGFTKLVCLSRVEDFLLHHLPNQYLGRMGLPFEQMHAQINTLSQGLHRAETYGELLPSPVGLNTSRWNKRYYGSPGESGLTAMSQNARHVLSIGCGDGAVEASLVARGAKVVGVPLDAVMAELARAKGIEVTAPDFPSALASLQGRRFDCILLLDVLHHVPDPANLLQTVAGLLGTDGQLILRTPNFGCLKYRLLDEAGRSVWKTRNPFQMFRLQRTTPRVIAGWLRTAQLRVRHIEYEGNARFGQLIKVSKGMAGPCVSRDILVTAQKVSSCVFDV